MRCWRSILEVAAVGLCEDGRQHRCAVRLDGGSVVAETFDPWWSAVFSGMLGSETLCCEWLVAPNPRSWLQAGAGVRVGCRLSVPGISPAFGRVTPL